MEEVDVAIFFYSLFLCSLLIFTAYAAVVEDCEEMVSNC